MEYDLAFTLTTSTRFMALSDASSQHPGSSPLNTVSPQSMVS